MWKRTVCRGIIVFSLVALVGCGSEELIGGIGEGQALEVIVLLRHYGIDAQKTPVGSGQDMTWTVTVASRDASNARQVLVENDLPRDKPKGFEEFFGKSKLIPTETEEKAIFLQAQAGELAQTIEAMPTVIDARVHISIPKDDPLRQLAEGEEPLRPSAAVFVKHWKPQEGTRPEGIVREEDIQKLVASSVAGLSALDVTVVRKTVEPVDPTPLSAVAGKEFLVMPLAGIALLLVIILLVLAMKNKSLGKQVATLAAEKQAGAAGMEGEPGA